MIAILLFYPGLETEEKDLKLGVQETSNLSALHAIMKDTLYHNYTLYDLESCTQC